MVLRPPSYVDLMVTLGFALPVPTAGGFTAMLASGGKVTMGKSGGGRTTFLFDLDIAADAVIVRWNNSSRSSNA